jgi:ribosome-binding factor A
MNDPNDPRNMSDEELAETLRALEDANAVIERAKGRKVKVHVTPKARAQAKG